MSNLVKQIEKDYKESVRTDYSLTSNYDVVPSGSLAFDIMTGIGGWPLGRLCILSGVESSGKTLMSLKAIAQAQKLGHRAAFLDLEHTFDEKRAIQLGVDVNELDYFQIKDLETGGDILHRIVSSGEYGITVFDSVNGASVKPIEEGSMEDRAIGYKAKIMSNIMMKCCGTASFNKTLMLFIAQWRESLDPYKPVVLPGGKAFAHASSLTTILRSKKDKENDNSLVIHAKVHKNKMAPPFKECEFIVNYNGQIDEESEIIDILTSKENRALFDIEQAGAYYTMPEAIFGVGTNRFQGTNNIVKALKAEPDLLIKSKEFVISRIK